MMFINHFNEIYVMINVAMNATIYGTNNVSRFGSFAMSVILSNKPPKQNGIYSKNKNEEPFPASYQVTSRLRLLHQIG